MKTDRTFDNIIALLGRGPLAKIIRFVSGHESATSFNPE